MQNTPFIVLMGVAGCGKSSLGEALAAAERLPLIEGDAFHPQANLDRMRAGVALTDEDRVGWLTVLGEQLALHAQGAVLTCSALKRRYRDQLRAAAPGLRFVFLEISHADALARVAQRGDAHLFPVSLVDSQFATLESPVGEPGVLRVDAMRPMDELVATVGRWLHDEEPS